METITQFITGEIKEADWTSISHFKFAVDLKNETVHFLDESEHNGASLINTIHSKFVNDFHSIWQDEFDMTVEDMYINSHRYKFRYIVYQDFLIWEYNLELESKGKHPFVAVKDKTLLYMPFRNKVGHENERD